MGTTPATFRHRNGTESRQQEGRQQARLKVRQGQRRRKGSTQRLECAQDTQSPPEHHLPPTQDSHPVEKSKIPTQVGSLRATPLQKSRTVFVNLLDDLLEGGRLDLHAHHGEDA